MMTSGKVDCEKGEFADSRKENLIGVRSAGPRLHISP